MRCQYGAAGVKPSPFQRNRMGGASLMQHPCAENDAAFPTHEGVSREALLSSLDGPSCVAHGPEAMARHQAQLSLACDHRRNLASSIRREGYSSHPPPVTIKRFVCFLTLRVHFIACRTLALLLSAGIERV